MLHVAVLGGGGDFYVLAESAAFKLTEVALIPDGSGGESAQLEGSPSVGFADWYRIPNNLDLDGGSLGQHTFGIQVGHSVLEMTLRAIEPRHQTALSS